MSILENNITEEEKLSGYSPTEKGDETFMLSEIDAYPGKLPDFTFEEEPIIPGEGTFLDNDDDEEYDSFDDESEESVNEDEEIEDGFEDNDFNFDDESNSDEEVVVGAFEDSDEDLISDFSEYDDEETSDDSDEESENDSNFNFDNEDDKIEELSEEEIRALEGGGIDNETEFNEENIDLGDDLKSVLQNDLKKSKDRKGNDFNFDDEIEVVSDEGFPIDDELNADVVNFSDIDADKPSNFGLDKLEEESDNKEEIKDENKKKDRKKLSKRMIYIYSGVAVFLLFSLLITAIMNKDAIFNNIPNDEDSTLVEDNSEQTNSNKNSSKATEKNIKKNNSKSEDKDELNNSEEFQKVDVSQVDEKASGNNSLSSSSLSENSGKVIDDNLVENSKNNKERISSESPRLKAGVNKKDLVISEPTAPIKNTVEDKKVNEKSTKTNTTKKRNSKANSKNKDKIKESSQPSKKSNSKDIATNNTKNKNVFKNERTSVVPYPRKAQSDEGLFIVQVYASQSKEDALSWLEKLKEQDINDAFISEQVIRDEIWYRVRFGNFKNKNDALETAAKLGYAQTWVDRVK